MLTEMTTLELTTAEQPTVENTLQKILNYLASSTYCRAYLLTRQLASETEYVLSCSWEGTQWRNFAWRYFNDVLTSANILFHVVSQFQEDGLKVSPPGTVRC